MKALHEQLLSLTPWLWLLTWSSKSTNMITTVDANNHNKHNNNNNNQNHVGHKQLLLFAGPHYSASTSVTTFFTRNTRFVDALQGWSWPALGRNQFSHLVTMPENEQVMTDLLDNIKDEWDDNDISKHGMIVGTAEFDRVGTVPYSNRDGIGAMEKVVDKVGLSDIPAHVTVIVNYRAPRLDQWISVFKQEQNTTMEATHHNYRYKNFLCANPNQKDGEAYNKLWETLDTSMNPLSLVIEYRKRGWNVIVIDMSGVKEEGLDISHTIACEVMHVPCGKKKYGYVDGMESRTYDDNHLDREFLGLNTENEEKLEKLLRLRDCVYREEIITDPGVGILHQDTLWQDCPPSLGSSKVEYLLHTDDMLDAIQSQKDCNVGSVTMDTIFPPPNNDDTDDDDTGDDGWGDDYWGIDDNGDDDSYDDDDGTDDYTPSNGNNNHGNNNHGNNNHGNNNHGNNHGNNNHGNKNNHGNNKHGNNHNNKHGNNDDDYTAAAEIQDEDSHDEEVEMAAIANAPKPKLKKKHGFLIFFLLILALIIFHYVQNRKMLNRRIIPIVNQKYRNIQMSRMQNSSRDRNAHVSMHPDFLDEFDASSLDEFEEEPIII